MSTTKKKILKVEQCNVLLLGNFSCKLDFIKNCIPYCKYRNDDRDVPKNITLKNNGFGITKNFFNVFDKKFCFIDASSWFEQECLYKVLINLNLHAILIFTDKYPSTVETYMKQYFTANNFPSDNVIFVVLCEEETNTLVTAINLEKKLKELHMNFEVSLNENLFFVRHEMNVVNFPKEFCESLEHFSSFQPCAQQFNVDIPILFNITATMFPSLIEVLHFIEAEMISLQEEVSQPKHLVIYGRRVTICKQCYFMAYIWCHDDETCEELENCPWCDGDTCQQCSCSKEDHISRRYFLYDSEKKRTRTDLVLEKNTIIHFLGTLYVFCELRNGLPDVCRNFNEEYWSLGKRDNVSSQEPIYKELENEIEELRLNSCTPTVEEVTFLIQQFSSQDWYSFVIDQYLQTKCELKFTTNTQQSRAANKSKQITNIQRPLKFPEMKTNAASHSKSARDVLLEDLRKELDELKISTSKEKKIMQEQINDLKRQIERNKTC